MSLRGVAEARELEALAEDAVFCCELSESCHCEEAAS